MIVHFINALKGVMTDNISMTIIVDDHIHLCDTGNFIIDFNTEKVFCGKIVPIVEIVNRTFFVIIACLITHIVKSVQEETSRATRRVKNIPILLWLHHFYAEFNNGTRSKILPKIALKETIHKLLKGNTFNIQIGFIKIDSFQMRNDSAKYTVIYLDRFCEYFGVFNFLLIIKRIDTFCQFR